MRKHRSKRPVINQPHVLPFDSNCFFLPNRFLNSLSEMGASTDCWGNWTWEDGKAVKVGGRNYLLLYLSLIPIIFFLSAFLSLGSSDRKHFCFRTNFRRARGRNHSVSHCHCRFCSPRFPRSENLILSSFNTRITITWSMKSKYHS